MTGWSTDFPSGLFDDYDCEVKRAYFSTDQKYNSGNTLLLVWETETDDPEHPEERVIFPLGKGWTSKDGGKTIVHDSGAANGTGRAKFIAGSMIARLITRCVDDFNMGDLLSSLSPDGPYAASLWVGMRFHMKSETISWGSGMKDSNKAMPQKFLGLSEGNDAAPAAKAAVNPADVLAKAKAKAAAKAPKKSLRDQAIEAMAPFVAAGDWTGAQKAAFEIEGVDEDADLVIALMDPDGLYAELVAGLSADVAAAA